MHVICVDSGGQVYTVGLKAFNGWNRGF